MDASIRPGVSRHRGPLSPFHVRASVGYLAAAYPYGVFSLLRGVLDIPSEGMPYILFSYAGLLPWPFLSSAVIVAVTTPEARGMAPTK